MQDLKKYLTDGWSWVHFLCGWLGMLSFYLILSGNKIERVFIAIVITFAIDFSKEVLDTVTAGIPALCGRYGFDARGFDKRDVLMCLIGILIGAIFTAAAL